MASEPPQIGHEGWDLVQCDWELRQRDTSAASGGWWARLAAAIADALRRPMARRRRGSDG